MQNSGSACARSDFRLLPLSLALLIMTGTCGCRNDQQPPNGSAPAGAHPETGKHAAAGANHETRKSPDVPAARSGDWFRDVTDERAIRFSYSTGRDAGKRTILETAGGGVGFLDYDLDRRSDLICVGGGTIDRTTGIPAGQP